MRRPLIAKGVILGQQFIGCPSQRLRAMSRIGLLMPALLLAVYVTAVSGGAATSLGVVLAKSTFGPQATQWQAPRSGWVLVLDYDGHGEAEGKLLLVDPEHDGVIGNLSVGYDPDLALSPDGRYIFL